MKTLLLISAGWGMCIGASVAGGQNTGPALAAQPIGITRARADSARPRPRRKAIEYSDAYATRLEIHKIGSYTMLPLFATEYYLGERLIEGKASGTEKSVHVGVAAGIGALFAVNTVTGVWNLWDSRKDPNDKTRRILHSALMLASDAGFALAAASAEGEDEGEGERERGGGGDDNNTHKTIALTSIGISTVGTVMMWLWK